MRKTAGILGVFRGFSTEKHFKFAARWLSKRAFSSCLGIDVDVGILATVHNQLAGPFFRAMTIALVASITATDKKAPYLVHSITQYFDTLHDTALFSRESRLSGQALIKTIKSLKNIDDVYRYLTTISPQAIQFCQEPKVKAELIYLHLDMLKYFSGNNDNHIIFSLPIDKLDVLYKKTTGIKAHFQHVSEFMDPVNNELKALEECIKNHPQYPSLKQGNLPQAQLLSLHENSVLS